MAVKTLLQPYTSLTPSQYVCRYLYVDHMLTAVQASPQNKVATLSGDSLELMASARAELQCMRKQVCQHHNSFATTCHLLVTVCGLKRRRLLCFLSLSKILAVT